MIQARVECPTYPNVDTGCTDPTSELVALAYSHQLLFGWRRLFLLISRAETQRSNGGFGMARKTIYVSDLTGREIDERDAAQVVIRYSDARRGQIVLDVNGSEVADLAAKGTRQARRGRKPKTTA
jgi:hypothetical protein